MSKKVIHVAGWSACPWYGRAAKLSASLQLLYPSKFESETHETPSRDEYRAKLDEYRAQCKSEKALSHTASPIVWLTEGDHVTFVGGCDATVDWARALLSPAGDAKVSKMKSDGVAKDHAFDYDVVVIGGGSGGLACSKEMAKLGAKVAVLDYVKPSPAGTTWGLGGTCVNVGCIPKKLMHTAAIMGDTLRDDVAAFGWGSSAGESSPPPQHSWDAMVESVQDHIKSLNFQYRVALREAGITYLNKLGKFKDKNTLTLTDKKGETTEVTAARFVVAVGGRPSRLDFEGVEHCIDSDDLFSLKKAPGRVLCIGAGYIALECGGFLAGLGYPTTCMVRSILLRGFDRECVDKIEAHMTHHGVSLKVGVTPAKIEKTSEGDVFKVTDSKGNVEEYDTVILAVGRVADTKGLNVEAVPGAMDSVNPKSLKFDVVDEQLPSAPHVYAIGDVVHGRPELTPVAIEAGLRLARRLYGEKTEPMDYENVATTVFTPLEYGAIGYSEEEATEALGASNVEVYISEFTPLEHTLSETRSERGDKAFAKLVADKTQNQKIVGFHYLGPNAGEITQGFSVAMRKGATYADFIGTVGIHPTVAEEFTTMAVTKSSGASAAKGGC
mmetsp:Transcript_19823/g.63755  ORF Transcript_19823/g.63755 Transcript_19823/m.63755 type:complete len:611 (+) Transcript_19823:129-1961(+)